MIAKNAKKNNKSKYIKSGLFLLVVAALFRFYFFDKNIFVMINQDPLTQVYPGWQSIRVLTANVGNVSLGSRGPYNNKLSEKDTEDAIAKNIQLLKPDIVFLQELMHPSQCEGWIETDVSKICYGAGTRAEPNQARRLLGNEYSILCSARMRTEIGHPVGMECIGVRTSVGTIAGCQLGELCQSTDGLDSVGDKCNPEFVIMSANVGIQNLSIRLVNAHPHSHNASCRDKALEQVFEGKDDIPALAEGKYTLIAGDFNFDPFRSNKKPPEVWQKHVGLFGSGKPFYYHSGVAERNPPYATSFSLFQKKTIDHMISNFARGICATLGETPGTSRIDDGLGMDHRAILCDLWIPSNVDT